ncbi:MAG: bifunctional DNA-formamidopyrimidine glycosylase/DNA-(apurinic or apyrimidinic site) lyase [Desulfobacterales bacterium]
MPELPEVQTVVNDLLAAGVKGRTISRARIYWPRTIHTPSPRQFETQIRNQTITGIRRRAKYIVLDLTSPLHLMIHLRMTGRIEIVSPGAPRDKHQHVLLDLDDGRQLRFHDTRKFGRFYLSANPITVLGHLGPEPLDPRFTARRLHERLSRHRRQLKPLLLDQTFIAGLGNIYVDEALWLARLHPLRTSDSLMETETHHLHRAIRKVLRQGLQNLGTTLGRGQANFYSVARRRGRNRDALNVFRRAGLPCPRCQTALTHLRVAQRATHICPACQK